MSAKFWMYYFVDANLHPNHPFLLSRLVQKILPAVNMVETVYILNHEEYYYNICN